MVEQFQIIIIFSKNLQTKIILFLLFKKGFFLYVNFICEYIKKLDIYKTLCYIKI